MLLLILRFLIKLANFLPLRFSLWLGKTGGKLIYFLLPRYRHIAYANIRFFLGMDRKKALRITRNLFENLGMFINEIFRFFRLNKNNIDSYVDFEGLENLDTALSEGKGVILLTAHLGNWEMSGVALGLKGYSIKVLARQQRDSRIDKLLNLYRQSSGIKVIKKGMALREIIQGLRNNEIVGMLGDQGGKKTGVCVKFFERYIFLPRGFLDIARRTGAKIVPIFIFPVESGKGKIISGTTSGRKNRKRYKIIIGSSLVCEGSRESIVQRYANILQDHIASCPEQYLWIYNLSKFTFSKTVLILDDGKAGHLNQSRAVASQIESIQSEKYPQLFASYPNSVEIIIKKVEYKNRFFRFLLTFCLSNVFLRYLCGSKCLRFCLTKMSYKQLIETPANIIISCGSSLISPNIFLKQQNFAKNIVIMSPFVFSRKFFNLIIAPCHDHLRQANVVSILGTPNLITSQVVETAAKKIKKELRLQKNLIIGIFVGDASYSRFQKILTEIIKVSQRLDAELLLATSRRTSERISNLIKQKLSGFALCKLLVIANERNIKDAVPKILGLSNLIIVTADSISMVSEAASSGKPVIVAKMGRSKKKKEEFLDSLKQKRIINLVFPNELENKIIEIYTRKEKPQILDDKEKIKRGVEQIL